MGSWQELFKVRKEWARELADRSESLAQEAKGRFDAVVIIQRALGVAVGNLQAHVRSLESKYAEAMQWNRQAGVDQKDILHSVEISESQLAGLPAKTDFIKFLPTLRSDADKADKRRLKNDRTLDSFATRQHVQDAIETIQHAHGGMTSRLEQLSAAVGFVGKDKDDLITAVEKMNTQSVLNNSDAASQLLEEIHVVSGKIASDSEHIATLPHSAPALAQASKMASQHQKNYMPNLRDFFDELVDVAQRVEEERVMAANQSLQHMRTIARIEASFAQVNSQLVKINFPSEAERAFEYLNLMSQLPFVYGALLVEAVRRQEWSERLKTESATLAEDIAGYREEEERRRKRWLKNIGPFVSEDIAPSNALNFDLNLRAEEQHWPMVDRNDVVDYLQALKQVGAVPEVIEELSEAVKDLDRPTKRQIRRAQGFKNGSIHELANGKGSFFLRDNDEVRVLRELNSKMEEDLKGQKSRVRKLEDLLYKQQQTARPSSANLFSPQDGPRFDPPTPEVGSPSSRAELPLSRKASANSRRTSVNASAEEKAMARKIVALEAELQEEKQRGREAAQARTEHETKARTEIEESRSTKKDLMENMEAQQREFANERRLLQEEVKEQKLKLEEMEDEVDRLLGSRDNERTDTIERVRALELALEEASRRAAELHAEKSSRGEIESEHIAALHSIRSSLNAEDPPPQSIAELLHELEDLAERSSRQTKDLNSAVDDIRSNRDMLQAKLDSHEQELERRKEQIKALEDDVSGLRNERAAEVAKAESFSAELDDARNQLRSLRTKFADGETGSEELRGRLENQAARASRLASELAQSKSHVNSLDFELSSLQRRHEAAQADVEASSKRIEQRNSRDREMTSRLVNVHDEMIRLLEALGLTIISRDGTLAIQRTSKIASASTSALVEPTDAPQIASVDLKPDASLLSWMRAPTTEEESKLFSSLMKQLSALDLSMFSEAIIKLRRDVEWTGKKWKQEARNYRDKYHRAQSEGHSKIAFRSFKEGDLALFLPTRNQATRPWAAFNIGAPHYFLREQDAHKLQNREWLVARISKVEERVVDLSKTLSSTGGIKGDKDRDGASIKSTASEGAVSFEDDNPFELSDGLRWYLLDAAEEKPGAPSTPGLGKSTVASANVDAKGSIRMKRPSKGNDVSAKLNKSLDSRRSSTSSKRASISAIPEDSPQGGTPSHLRPGSRSSATSPSGLGIQISSSPLQRRDASEEVGREDLLFGP